MDYYIDIQIKPDLEMQENVLLNKVFSKLHKALCTLKSTNIGISFPKYQVLLGDILRIHSTKEKINELQNLNWLGGLIEYCQLGSILPVPKTVMYRTISRKQANMTQAKLNRLIRRGSITPSEIKNYKARMFSQSLDNAYLELISGSNGHKHRRYLSFGDLQINQTTGLFDQFGLSKEATIPWF